MTTKNLILEKAIELLNEYGYAAVTMRNIADATNKSVGNITYHYKKKSDLLRAIVDFQQEDLKSLELNSDVDINGLAEQLKKMLAFQKKYYFYFSNMIELRKKHHDIISLQMKVRADLTLHFVKVIENFERRGLFKISPNKEFHKHLAKGIVLLMMSWVQQIALDDSEKHEELLNIVWSIIYPNLTEKGIQQYEEVFSI